MRQAGAEAAQIAKEGKKKVEVLVGVGNATEPTEKETEGEIEKKTSEKSGTIPPPIKTDTPHTVESISVMQSPNSTAWKQELEPISSVAKPDSEKLASMQSPTSTAWKPAETYAPITTHSGSSVENVSKECIKKIEDEQTIAEEDEDDDDDDSD